MQATIHTFPAFQAMNAPRAWILAVIIALHLGFFALLSSGMGHHVVEALRPPTVLTVPAPEPRSQPPETHVSRPVNIHEPSVSLSAPQLPAIAEDLAAAHASSPPLAPPSSPVPVHRPQISLPEIDPRIGLSPPLYPAADIRAGHTGTVLLSVYVLEDDRVGAVRLDRSSGHRGLDESALREARRWRFKAGTRDGLPVPIWRQIPVTFRLEDGARF